MGDFKGASAVHFNFPLLSFYLCTTFKLGLPLPVSLFFRNRGGLVNDPRSCIRVEGKSQSREILCVRHAHASTPPPLGFLKGVGLESSGQRLISFKMVKKKRIAFLTKIFSRRKKSEEKISTDFFGFPIFDTRTVFCPACMVKD